MSEVEYEHLQEDGRSDPAAPYMGEDDYVELWDEEDDGYTGYEDYGCPWCETFDDYIHYHGDGDY